MRNQILSFAVCFSTMAAAPAQVINWNALVGTWNSPGNWLPMNVPDAPGESAVIGVSGAVVTLNISPTVDAASISHADARLNLGGFTLDASPMGLDNAGLLVANSGASVLIGNLTNSGAAPSRGVEVSPGASLFLTSPVITNTGRIEINPTNAVAQTILRADVNTMLTGAGTLHMSSPANRAILSTLDPAVITQASAHTIRGMGQLNAALINHGLVSADISGNILLLQSNTKTNHGTLRAVNNAFLDLTGIAVTQGAGGLVLGDGGTVRFFTASIDGGSTNTMNGGAIQFVSGSNTLNSLTNFGAISQIGGTNVFITGDGLTNDGVYTVNPDSLVAQTVLQFNVSGDLEGVGEVVLASPNNRAILATGAGATITHAPTHTIRGMGQINASLINNGLVSADVAGNILTLQSNHKTNNSLIEAVNGSFLDITSITITQDPAAMLAADASTIRLSNATINDGTLTTTLGGVFQVVSGTNLLNSVTALGRIDQIGGTNVFITGDGLTNDGVYTVNPASLVAQTVLQFDNSGDLDGVGEVVLGSPSNRAILATGAGAMITHAPTHTIRGMGQVNASLINNGLVSADVAGNILTLQSNHKTNNSLIEAVNGSFLDITSITITQDPAAMLAADASTIRLSGATISGGTLTTNGGGLFITTSGTSTLTSVLNNADIDIVGGTTIVINGTGLTNNADITINPASAVAVTILRFDTTSDLLGSGRIVMSSIVNRSQVTTGPGVTLTNTAPQTIEGAGEIHAALINNGLVEANTPGAALNLLTNHKTNNTTIRAVGGAFLDVSSIVLTQSPGAELLADASTIRFNSATIVGGTVRTINGGSAIMNTGTTTLTGITFEGMMSQPGGLQTNISGSGIVNNGTITINPSAAIAVTPFHFTQTGALDGTGTLVLAAPANRSNLSGAVGVTITNGPSHTIAGLGQVTAPLVLNDGIIAPGLSAGSLQVFGVLTLRATSVLDLELGGTGAGTFDSLVGNGAVNLGGTLRARFINEHFPAGAATYAVITTTNHPGRFASFDLPPLDAGRSWTVEYLPGAVRLRAGPFCFGDATFDDLVNFADVTAVLANFGADYLPAPGTGPGDSNRDGIVNFADVTNTLANFNAACP